jgi:MscS family membrane protein
MYLLLSTNLAIAEPHPLAPPDTSSPRATLKSYLNIMGDYAHLMRVDLHTKDRASEMRDQQLEDKAELCFDLSQIARERVDDIANDVLNMLIEILDRIDIPPFEEIPDAADARSGDLTRWSLPNTEITIAKVKNGPREGEWLFSPQTVARLPEFYQKIKRPIDRMPLRVRSDRSAGSTNAMFFTPRRRFRPHGSRICRPG